MRGLARVILFAKDFERLKRFYRDVVGLPLIAEDPPGEFATLDAGACQLCLHAIPAAVATGIVITDPPQPRTATAIKIVFAAADVAAAVRDLAARGVAVGAVHRFGAQEFCDAVDPEGNVFQVANVVP